MDFNQFQISDASTFLFDFLFVIIFLIFAPPLQTRQTVRWIDNNDDDDDGILLYVKYYFVLDIVSYFEIIYLCRNITFAMVTPRRF